MKRGVRLLATMGALGLGLAVVAPPSVAGPPPDHTWLVQAIDCTGTFGDRELVVTGYFDAGNASGGGDAEFHDGQTLVWGNVEQSSVYDGQDFVLDVTFVYGNPQDGEAEAAAGEPGTSAGTMTITGTAVPSGEVRTEATRYRQGNAWTWWTYQEQALTGEGTITAATGDVAFTAGSPLQCGGHITLETYSATEPATRIERATYSQAHCTLPGPAESFLDLGIWGEEAMAALGIGVDWAAEQADWWAQGPIRWSGSAITGELEIALPTEYAGRSAGLDLTVGSTVIDRGTQREKGRQYSYVERYASYPLTGAVVLPDGTRIGVEDCALTTSWTLYRNSSRAGQKPGGKPPVNDLHAGAVTLAGGTTLTESTRGATVAPEAPCVIANGEEAWEVPFGRTVWFSFTGTGAEVTLSTLGTSRELDTVMGVYDAVTMDQLACADEGTDPKQGWAAAVVLPTVAGARYLVQVGGFDPQEEASGPMWGDLVMTRQ